MPVSRTEGIDPIGLRDTSDVPIDPATEPTLQDILAAIGTGNSGLSGTSANGQTVCTLANTWYAMPSGTAPTATYQLIANHEVTAGTVRVAFSNSGTPSTTNGVIWPKNVLLSGFLGPTSDTVYVSSDNAGDTLNWSTKLQA